MCVVIASASRRKRSTTFLVLLLCDFRRVAMDCYDVFYALGLSSFSAYAAILLLRAIIPSLGRSGPPESKVDEFLELPLGPQMYARRP